MKVAVFSGGYLPGFKAGGPIVSVSRIIEADPECEFRVITRNHDEGDSSPYPGVGSRFWIPVGRAQVAYLRPGIRDLGWIVRQLRDDKPDVYYLNSLHNPWFTLLPLLAIKCRALPRKPVVIAPRGETSAGALRIKERKKKLWRPAVKWLIGSHTTWHFSSVLEEKELRAWWGADLPRNHGLFIRANPAVAPRAVASSGPPANTSIVTFASRVAPKKGLDHAIRLLAALNLTVEFRVYGVRTDLTYWRECERLAESELPAGTIRYMGPYEPSTAQNIFAGSSLFLFPTHGENFGHVIAEALSVGCPVVVSPTTPWTDTIGNGGGHIIHDCESTVEYIRATLEASPNDTFTIRSTALEEYSLWFFANQNPGCIFEDVVP